MSSQTVFWIYRFEKDRIFSRFRVSQSICNKRRREILYLKDNTFLKQNTQKTYLFN